MPEKERYGLSLHGQAIEGGGTLHETLKNLAGKMGKDPRHARMKDAMDRGFEIFKAAESVRHDGKGSHDPHYSNSKKNK